MLEGVPRLGFHAGTQWDMYLDALKGMECDRELIWDLARLSPKPWCEVERGSGFEFEDVWGWGVASIKFDAKTVWLKGRRKTCTLRALYHAVLALKYGLPYPAKRAVVPTWLDGAWFKGAQTFPRGNLLVLVDDDDEDPRIKNAVVVSTHGGEITIVS